MEAFLKYIEAKDKIGTIYFDDDPGATAQTRTPRAPRESKFGLVRRVQSTLA